MSSVSDEAVAALEVHRCGPEDRAEQARLFNRCFKKRIDAADLSWRYDANPQGGAISLVYRPPGEEAVCSFAYMPRTARVFGDDATAGSIGQQGDVMTDPDWRRRGLVMKLSAECAKATLEAGWPLSWGFPNRQSASVFRRVNWESVGDIRPWDFYFRAHRQARAERFKQGRLLALRLPWDRRRCVAGRRSLATEGFEVRRLERFPDEVGGISEQVERRYCFMVRRDAAYLNWRFLETPSQLHKALGIYDAEGAFRGYCVTQPAVGDGIGYVVDLLGAEDQVVRAALSAGLDDLERGGAMLARATAVDGSWWQTTLEGAGFLPPKPDNHLFVYVFVQDEEHPLAAVARDASKWYLTDGDRDDELMG